MLLLHRPDDCIGFTPSCPPTFYNKIAPVVVWLQTARTEFARNFWGHKPCVGCHSRGGKNHKGDIFKYNVGCMQQPPRKKSLATCKLFNSTQKVIQTWTPNRLATVISYFATWAREETINSIICKPLKLLSTRRLSSLFTFAPRLFFMSHELQHIRRFAKQQNKASRRYNVATQPFRFCGQPFSVCVPKSAKSMTKLFRVPTKICGDGSEFWVPVAAWAPQLGGMECGWYNSVCSHRASKAHKG